MSNTINKETLSKASIASILRGTEQPIEDIHSFVPISASKAIAIYDKEGNLLGYIPIYDDFVGTL